MFILSVAVAIPFFHFCFVVRCFSHVLIIFCICCRSIKCIVWFGARGFGVTKVVKFILQLFFPSLHSFYFCFSLLYVRSYSFPTMNQCADTYFIHTTKYVCFFSFHLPRIIYCFRCNFILFAVRLCFFIFTINIIGFCCCCCSFYECCVWISGVCVCFFPHLFNQVPTLPSIASNSFSLVAKKRFLLVLFRYFHFTRLMILP